MFPWPSFSGALHRSPVVTNWFSASKFGKKKKSFFFFFLNVICLMWHSWYEVLNKLLGGALSLNIYGSMACECECVCVCVCVVPNHFRILEWTFLPLPRLEYLACFLNDAVSFGGYLGETLWFWTLTLLWGSWYWDFIRTLFDWENCLGRIITQTFLQTNSRNPGCKHSVSMSVTDAFWVWISKELMSGESPW